MLWNLLAWVLAWPPLASWLIRRALRTPYTHIMSPDGRDCYMARYWLFNPYPESGAPRRWRFPISIRVHRILRPDSDPHLHDHPWNARTFLLGGWYVEERQQHALFWRKAGQSVALKHDDFHRIVTVGPHGAWTLFVTGRYRGTWGFQVQGVKVPWREYLKC